jgi:hypothetical protein
LSVAALKAGALAQGYSSDLWTLGRVGKLIETLTGQRYCESGVCSSGWASPASGRRNVRCSVMRRLFGNGRLSAGRRLKTKAAREGRIIIFIDESGISERPHRVSTWAYGQRRQV